MFWKFFFLSAALILSISFSATVLWVSTRRWSDPNTVRWIATHRTYVQITVQIISTIVGGSQVFIINSIITFSTNIRLSSRPTTLDTLQLRHAATVGMLGVDLPRSKILLSLFWLGVIQVPSLLWTGSITPVVTTSDFSTTFQIPDYNESTYAFWGRQCPPAVPCDDLLGTTSELGTFTYVAWKTLTGLLVNSVEQASSHDASTPQYQKLDNTGFTYHGRSYGVASTVGLVEPERSKANAKATILNYTYLENGYSADVSCSYNKSSRLAFYTSDMVTTPGGIYAPQGFWAQGSLPNGVWAGFPTWGVLNSDFVTALAAVRSPSEYMYGFVAGKSYGALNQTQCEVTFRPASFKVAVDMSTKNVSVTKTHVSAQSQLDIDPTGGLANVSFHGVSFLSQTLTTLYTSVLGDSFLQNIENVRRRNGHLQGTVSDAITGIEQGLELLLDHFLGSSGAGQAMLQNGTKKVDTTMTLEVVRFGNPNIAYTAFGMTLVVVIATVAEAIRTRMWTGLPIVDFLDLKSAIVGVAKDTGLAPQAVKDWSGDAGDRSIGELEMVMNNETNSLGFR
ncbi:hypothetical protein EDB81DRAFT_883333 [Dactylonectria macrodidyma]|uniref:Uncharacterized protein n=1 Tax=Dactylonectria macrodidyma TaxID=307937 RepID=A0A9P9J3W2_9HYPO|nr:hypothetical protein EDB81DRAFT_883333 [Dactylonectria macrodidyma]